MSNLMKKPLVLKMIDINEEILIALHNKIKSFLILLHSFSNSKFLSLILKNILNENFYPLITTLIFYLRCFRNNNCISPGEEFTGIKYYRSKSIFFYFLILSLQKMILAMITNMQDKIKEKLLLKNNYSKLRLFKVIEMLTPSFSTLGEINICYFLINKNNYYNLYQKIAKIKFVENKNNNNLLNYNHFFPSFIKIIGCLSFLRLSLKGFTTIKKVIKYLQSNKTLENNDNNNNNQILHLTAKKKNSNMKDKCTLCLDKYKDKSVTWCGHMFCWSCITQYLEKNPECPQCRKKAFPNQVIFLQNYD